MPGASLELTIRKRSLFESQPAESVRLRARSVRLGADGVGLAFEPDHVGSDVWMSLFVKAERALRQKDTVRALRISRALAFLRRVSPAAENAVMEHIAGECMYESGERAVETILNAEELVEAWNFAIRSGVDDGLILRILENASKTNSELVRRHWTGLLASSIQYWAKDCESAQFVSLLSLIDPVQIRIFEAVCSRALRAGRDAGDSYSRNLPYSRHALRMVAGVSNYQVVEQHLDTLSFLGLLEPAIKCAWFEEFEQIELTPTERGLKFYARCRGLLDLPDASARAHDTPVIQMQTAKEDSILPHRESLLMYAPAS